MSAWESFADRIEQRTGGRHLGYSGRIRRQGREVERVVRAVLSSSCRPRADVIHTYWWDEVKNFGDLLTPYLLRGYGVLPVLAPPGRADLVGVGSIIHHLPVDSTATLWGSGVIQDGAVDLPGVTCLALRGEITRDLLGSPRVEALGDPGLLLGDTVVRAGTRYDVGLVVHYIHAQDPWLASLIERFHGSVQIISVTDTPASVARKIASCRTIVSTSLHGVITADSLGVPVSWVRMPRALMGGDFKFRDHETVVRPARDRSADASTVEALDQLVALACPADEGAVAGAKEALRSAARRIPEVTNSSAVPTWQVPMAGLRR